MMFSRLLIPLVAIAAPVSAQQSPQSVLDELFATERALSQAAEKLSPAEGIASLMAKDGTLLTRPAPVVGPEAAAAALKANPANAGNFAKWRSVHGGISADGQHGYTLGYLEIEGGDPKTAKRRYLAYWTRGADGWRVATMKQMLQTEKEEYLKRVPPSLPAKLVAPSPAKAAQHAASLAAAEKAFSDRAQVVGTKQAFQEFGRPDAVHVVGQNGIIVGLDAIRKNFDGQPGVDEPAKIEWSADKTIVASSGDLGVNIGHIRRNEPIANPPPGAPTGPSPFITIWRRDSVDQPWKYIAE